MECSSGSLAIVSGMAFEAALATGQGIHVIYGMNPARLETQMEHAIANGATALLSFGTAGGLSPALASGAVVIARGVRSDSGNYDADVAWHDYLIQQLAGAVSGDVYGASTTITSANEKSELFNTYGTVAVDMESQHVARVASRHGLPFAVLRVVLDDAQRTLPPAALCSARADGTLNYVALLRSLLTQPQQLPAMLRLSRDHGIAKKRLLDCGNLLRSSRFGMHLAGSLNIR
ncbi:MAG: hypothetical protein K2Q12_00300 [Rickettsiales bacterium]|nr:hypothetical protein [Rickettsiales bacterium]